MGEGGASVSQQVGKLPSSELEPGWDRGATACRHRRGGGQMPGALRKVTLPLFALAVCEHDQRAQYGNSLKVLA